MTTPDYTQKMSKLRILVGQHAKIAKNGDKNAFSNITSTITTINTQSPIFYTIPTIVLIILLLIMKPGFLCENHIDKDNIIIKKIKYTSLLLYGIVGGGIISIGLFAYLHRKKT